MSNTTVDGTVPASFSGPTRLAVSNTILEGAITRAELQAKYGFTPPNGMAATNVSVEDNDAACPTCGQVPDTHRKRQVRHLHCKNVGMVRFIIELQRVLEITGGFKRMIDEVKTLKGKNTL